MDFGPTIKYLRRVTQRHNDESTIGSEAFFRKFASGLDRLLFRYSLEGYKYSFAYMSEGGAPKNPAGSFYVNRRLVEPEFSIIRGKLQEGERRIGHDELSMTTLMIENLIKDEIQSILLVWKKFLTGRHGKILNEYLSEFHVVNLDDNVRTAEPMPSKALAAIANTLGVPDEEIGKLALRFDRFADLTEEEHLVYLIKPYTYHTEFNVILVLGTTEPIQASDFHLLRLLMYRFSSEVAILKLIRAGKELSKATINYGAHAVRTSVRGLLFSPIANLRRKYPEEESFAYLDTGVKLVYALATVLNLIAKVESTGSLNRSDLDQSELFSERQDLPKISGLLDLVELHRRGKGEELEIKVEPNNADEFVADLRFGDWRPTDPFWLLFLMTIFENAAYYGAPDYYSGIIEIDFKYDRATKTFYVTNQTDDDSEVGEPRGNFQIINKLLEGLNVGRLTIRDKEPINAPGSEENSHAPAKKQMYLFTTEVQLTNEQ